MKNSKIINPTKSIAEAYVAMNEAITATHPQVSKSSANPKPDDHVHSKAIMNYGYDADSKSSHTARYKEDHPLVTSHFHAHHLNHDSENHAVSYSGPRHAVAAAVDAHHRENDEASRDSISNKSVEQHHPEIFKNVKA